MKWDRAMASKEVLLIKSNLQSKGSLVANLVSCRYGGYFAPSSLPFFDKKNISSSAQATVVERHLSSP